MLADLPPLDRAVLVLRYSEDLPVERGFASDPDGTGALLSRLLPAGADDVRQVRSWSDEPDSVRAGSLLLEGGLVSVLVESGTAPGCGDQPEDWSCAAVTGGHLSTATYDEPMGGPESGIVAVTATYLTDDGFAVTVTAWNASVEKYGEPVSAQPVLFEEQVATVAQDPAWLAAE